MQNFKHKCCVSAGGGRTDEVLRVILPEKVEVPTGFETIGHIAHLNLREAHLPFKQVIGQVILDKNPRLRTVVNKTSSISNKFRVFPMELLAGVEDYVAELRQQGVVFRFDFSRVYWNSRLDTEHVRMVSMFKPNDRICTAHRGRTRGRHSVAMMMRSENVVVSFNLMPARS
jgi:tRNA (guanine37-N1)-methyltransferase